MHGESLHVLLNGTDINFYQSQPIFTKPKNECIMIRKYASALSMLIL